MVVMLETFWGNVWKTYYKYWYYTEVKFVRLDVEGNYRNYWSNSVNAFNTGENGLEC